MSNRDESTVANDETVREPIGETLEWIGFDTGAGHEAIIEEGFKSFEEISGNSSKDIESLAYSFTKRTVSDERITFGLQRTKRIKAMIWWALEFDWCSKTATIEGLN